APAPPSAWARTSAAGAGPAARRSSGWRGGPRSRWRRWPHAAAAGSGRVAGRRRPSGRGGRRPLFLQQALGRLLERGVVGDRGKAEHLTQLGPFREELFHAAVVLLEELTERQDGEELVLGVDLAVELGGVGRQGLPGHGQGGLRQPQRRLGHQACSAHISLYACDPRWISTKQSRVRAAARTSPSWRKDRRGWGLACTSPVRAASGWRRSHSRTAP